MLNTTAISKLAEFRDDEGGWGSIFSMFMAASFLVMGGLAIDFASGLNKRSQLQSIADAVALAALQKLPDETAARQEALALAAMHFGTDDAGAIGANDLVFGSWDTDADSFVAGAMPYDAVAVQSSRTSAKNNALPTYLLRLVGFGSFDVNTLAIARGKSDASCQNGGFFANDKNISHSENDYIDGFCIYGGDGVTVESNNTFEDGARVVMPNLGDLSNGSNNPGLNDALLETSYTLTLPGMVNGVISNMKSGSLAGMPDFITNGPINVEKIEKGTTLQPNTLYIVKESVDLGSNKTISNVAIVAGSSIQIGSSNTLHNVVIASEDKIKLETHNTFAHPDPCGYGRYSSYFWAKKNIEFVSHNYLAGVQLASQQGIQLGSHLIGVVNVHAEAGTYMEYQSSDVFGGCADGLTSDFGVGPDRGSPGFVQYALAR